MDTKRLGSDAFAPSGRTSSLHHTQDDALGYVLVAPSGRALNACAYSLIQLELLYLINCYYVMIYAGD